MRKGNRRLLSRLALYGFGVLMGTLFLSGAWLLPIKQPADVQSYPAARVFAESEQVQVTDAADLFSASEERQLAKQAEELELSLNWDVMLVTTNDALGMTAREYAEEWVDANTQGDNGVACLIDMDNRELYITAFGEAIYYLTDERQEEILDDAYAGASDGNYFEAAVSMLEGIDEALQRGIPSDQYTYDEDTEEVIGYYREGKRITIWEALLAVAAALAAGGITIGAVIGKYRLKWGSYQYSCRENGKVELSLNKDIFVNQIVTHRRIPKEPPKSGSGGNSGRSTVHTGAGGRNFSGSGRKF